MHSIWIALSSSMAIFCPALNHHVLRAFHMHIGAHKLECFGAHICWFVLQDASWCQTEASSRNQAINLYLIATNGQEETSNIQTFEFKVGENQTPVLRKQNPLKFMTAWRLSNPSGVLVKCMRCRAVLLSLINTIFVMEARDWATFHSRPHFIGDQEGK